MHFVKKKGLHIEWKASLNFINSAYHSNECSGFLSLFDLLVNIVNIVVD